MEHSAAAAGLIASTHPPLPHEEAPPTEGKGYQTQPDALPPAKYRFCHQSDTEKHAYNKFAFPACAYSISFVAESHDNAVYTPGFIG